MTTVWIEGLEAYGYHGVPDAEQAIGHRYRCDLALDLADCPARQTDAVQDTVDYGQVATLAVRHLTGPSHRTVERLAQVIGEAILQEAPRVDAVTVRLGKPCPPAPVIATAVGVTLVVRRS